jgi:acyl carrier protein
LIGEYGKEKSMTRKTFIEEFERMLEMDPGSIKGDELLADLEGWDSMAAIGFIAMIDAVANEAVAPGDLATCKTVADLMSLAHAQES